MTFWNSHKDLANRNYCSLPPVHNITVEDNVRSEMRKRWKMIGILELEREEKRRAKLEKQLAKQNRSQFDDEQKKLKFFNKFCNVVRTIFSHSVRM